MTNLPELQTGVGSYVIQEGGLVPKSGLLNSQKAEQTETGNIVDVSDIHAAV